MLRKIGLIIIVCVLLYGCGGYRKASLDMTDSGISYRDTNVSILQRPINPEEMANARLTLAFAAQMEKEVDTQTKAGSDTSGTYIGLIINDDPYKTAFVPHPEASIRMKIRQTSFMFFKTSQIAKRVTIYDGCGNYRAFDFVHKGGEYNGKKYDYYIRIYSL